MPNYCIGLCILSFFRSYTLYSKGLSFSHLLAKMTTTTAKDGACTPASANDPVWFASLWGGMEVTDDGFPTTNTDSSSVEEGSGSSPAPSSSSADAPCDQHNKTQKEGRTKKMLIGIAALFVVVLITALAVAFSPRDAAKTSDDIDSNSERRLKNWKFLQGPEASDDIDTDDESLLLRPSDLLRQNTTSWQDIIVPHSWNVHDGQDGGTYYRGTGWYQHTLYITAFRPSQRYFLRFQAIGTVGTVYIDGQEVTRHEGGYTAFAVEITEHIHGDGTYDIRVKADNSYRDHIMPLSGDFTVAGGIHRPVDLIVKGSTMCLSPLDDASPGVRLFQENVSAEMTSLRVNVLLDNGGSDDDNEEEDGQPAQVVITLRDATGNKVASDTLEGIVSSGSARSIETILTISEPHLWHGIDDPYLYTLQVDLLYQKKLADRYIKKVGFRFMHIDPEQGFFLNGQSFPLRGVNMHYDHQDMGAALTDEQIRKDFALVRELGANSVRLAHYPHAALSHQLCDEMGLLVWAEIPLVNEMRDTPEFALNARQQTLEMIKQLGNYHSVYTWGLTNEMFQKTTDDPFDLLRSLNDLMKETDPSRFTIQATNRNRNDLNTITDTYGVNYYPGWYGTDPHAMGNGMTRYNKESGDAGLSIAEYGAGGSILHQSQDLSHVEPKGKWHPEQWQAYLHEAQYSDIVNYRPTWGSYIWLMFDFSSDKRNEGDRPGVNDKGLVTHDHVTKKDSFYFYQANWRRDIPIVHLTSKRHQVRTERITPVKVYSNLPKVELFVNGISIGSRQPNVLSIAQWEGVELDLGENTILVRDSLSGLADSIVWTYDPNATVITKESSSIVVEGTKGMFRASHAEFGNGPSMAFDNDSETRWASNKVGAWISRELEDEVTVSGVSILWYGSGRSYTFEVKTSMDGNTWRPAFAGNSTSDETPEKYEFGQVEQARHIRITCYGSDVNKWSSIREVTLLTE